MRMVALVEAWVVLLASVTACGPSATGQPVRLDTPGASTDKPICTWEHAPAHSFLLGYQIMRKEGSWSEQGTKRSRITAVGTAPGVNADSSGVHSNESPAARRRRRSTTFITLFVLSSDRLTGVKPFMSRRYPAAVVQSTVS